MVIDAELFLPQSRERVFIIGVDKALCIPAELVADGPNLPFYPPVAGLGVAPAAGAAPLVAAADPAEA